MGPVTWSRVGGWTLWSGWSASCGYLLSEETVPFTVGCEQRQLPVALASMASKYIRELLMARFNAYWTAAVPGLAPTAGYFRDGRRFWAQVEPELARLGLDAELVLRCR